MMTYPAGPSYQDIEEMRRIRTLLNQADNTPPARNNNPQKVDEQSRSSTSYSNPDVEAMANIMKKFNNATNNTAERLVEDQKYDPQLREAMRTTSTENGFQSGSWKVTAVLTESPNGKSRKAYDVINVNDKSKVCEGLIILEAAHAVVRYLNKGLTLEHPKMMALLDLEETYYRNRNDAIRFKQRYERCVALNEHQAGDVFASRYQVARAHAIAAQDQIKSTLESIR